MLFQESEGKILVDAENLIDDVLTDRIDGQDLLEALYQVAYRFQAIYEPVYCYSAKINVLIEVLNHGYLLNEEALLYYFKELVKSRKYAFEAEQLSHEAQEKLNRNKLSQYVTLLTTHYARLLFVRVDLGYLDKASCWVGIQQVQSDIAKLTKYIREKRNCFQYLHGYAWALEQGKQSGSYHCHLLLMFDGSQHQMDWYLSQQVGALWQKITLGQGKQFYANNPEYKEIYRRNGSLGLDMIHRGNEKEIENALFVASYLAKPQKHDQTLRVRTNKHMKTFATGLFNKPCRRGVERTYKKLAAR